MKISLVWTLVILTWLTVTSGASIGSGSIYARDSDKISGLRNKLQRLHDLLARLDDEADLNSIISSRDNKSSPVSSEDMKGGLQAPVTTTTTTTTDVPESQSDLLNSKQDEDSILVLSKALARLQQPFDDKKDSTGDYLGTDYNGETSKTEDMEKVITQALENLSRDKSSSPAQKAMKTVVDRLMQDIDLIHRFGFSHDDVIQSLLKQIERQKELSNMETELESLAKDKYI